MMIDEDGDLYVSQNNTHTQWFKESSRNLLNIGTISSGAITSSGTITTSGSLVVATAVISNITANGSGSEFWLRIMAVQILLDLIMI